MSFLNNVYLNTETIPAKYSFLQNLGISPNVFLILTWLAMSFAYAFGVGRKRGPILLLATYAGLAIAGITKSLNLASLVKYQNNEFFAAFIFLFVCILAFVAIHRTISKHAHIHSSKQGMLLLGLLESGAFLSSLGTLMPATVQNQVTGFANMLFTTSWTHILWLLLPLLVLLVGEYGRRIEY